MCKIYFNSLKHQLHILFLCGWYPSKVLPTNGDFIQRHAEAVATQHKVTVVHIISDQKLETKKQIEFQKLHNVNTYIGYIQKTSNPILKFLRFYKIYQEIIAKIDTFNLVHLNTLYPFGLFAMHLKKTKKVPYIISEHWTGYHSPQSKNLGFFRKMISKFITKKASYVCPVTNNLANSMKNIGFGGNFQKVPNVVDTEIFTPKENSQKEFTIVHVSSLFDAHKNISDMLKVAKNLEDEIGFFTWKFIGGTSKNFKPLIKKLNFKSANIQFINHIDQKELGIHLQNADVFVLFSNYENLPCVILESFSCGIPVITTNVGGISEYFPKGFGKLIEPKNTAQLYNALLHYHKKTNLNKDKMHIYAVNNFSKQAICNSFSKLYYQSLKKKN